MSRSKREIPHYYLCESIPMREAQAWLACENQARPVTERMLIGVLQLKAVALSLKKFADLNGFYRANAFQPAEGIHIGVAISLRQGGLIAPAIHDVDKKSLPELMRDMSDLVKRARAGSLRSSELSDATVTLTNLGDQGSEAVYGVIYPPQVALVAFGRLVERPWAEAGEVRFATGFAIGGVAPVGLARKLPCVLDRSLKRFETVFAAAGHPNCIFPTTVDWLKAMTGAIVSYNISAEETAPTAGKKK